MKILIQENASENVIRKMAAILYQPQCVKSSHCNAFEDQVHIDFIYEYPSSTELLTVWLQWESIRRYFDRIWNSIKIGRALV